ncbi:taste receptor type 2 member 8-like [Pogoniulus pusillus]|uniref:taste receptor type 2 member 8-like n=1 Tax=Pogoniulus pusillus TaxID=488313 RepID=UPI0030B9A299
MAACFSQEKFNVTSYDAMAFAIITLQTLAGLWINGFIVCVLCVTWVKKKVFNSNEKILMFLGCSCFWDLCTTWVFSIVSVTYPQCLLVNPMPQIVAAILSFFYTSNTWASVSLCVFYCVKIANFQHTFFIYLKRKIDRIVPWLFLVSVLFALITGILAYDISYRAVFPNLNSTAPMYLWNIRIMMDEHTFALFCITGFLSTTSFLTAIISALLLLFSLWKHKCRMQASSVRNITMDAHTKAMKSILSFAFIYSIHFTGYVLSIINANKTQYALIFLSLIFQYVLPIVHSLILILINPKLEKTFIRTLSCFRWELCKE